MSDEYSFLKHFSPDAKTDESSRKKSGRPSTRPDFAAEQKSEKHKRRTIANVFRLMMPPFGIKKKNPQPSISDQHGISAEQREAFFRRQEELRQKRVAKILAERQRELVAREIPIAETEVKTEAKENSYRQPEIANPAPIYDHIRKPRKKDFSFHPHNDLDKKRDKSALSSASSSQLSARPRFSPYYSSPYHRQRLLSSPAAPASSLFEIPSQQSSMPRNDSRMSLCSTDSSSGQASPVSPTLSEESSSDSSLGDVVLQFKKFG